MTKTEQLTILADQIAKLESLIINKGDDYAGEERLDVFYDVANLLDISPVEVSLVFIVTKILRIKNLIKSDAEPNFENIRDSFCDLQCYSLLSEQIFLDQKQYEKHNPMR